MEDAKFGLTSHQQLAVQLYFAIFEACGVHDGVNMIGSLGKYHLSPVAAILECLNDCVGVVDGWVVAGVHDALPSRGEYPLLECATTESEEGEEKPARKHDCEFACAR